MWLFGRNGIRQNGFRRSVTDPVRSTGLPVWRMRLKLWLSAYDLTCWWDVEHKTQKIVKVKTSWSINLLKKTWLLQANNKGADQPAHPHSLINAFAIRYMESNQTVSMQSLNVLTSLCTCSWAGWFELYLVRNPEDRFSCFKAYII